jgi:biotin carboxyl carrier protein
MLSHEKMMAKSEYASELVVEEKEFAVAQADLEMKLTETKIDVLKRFTKKEELAKLNGAWNAAKAMHEANLETAYADEERLKRAKDELEHCVVHAARSGMVIYPTGKEWGNAPDIEEGATVHKDQVLLLMPDLSRMQVKVGIHESIIDRIKPGLSAIVTLPGKTLDGGISYVAPVAKPAGWWTGNVVKYDTIVELSSAEGLKPGMSVEVEVILARHVDMLLIPTAAVMETETGRICWVQKGNTAERRTLELGDSSDMFIVVEAGLTEGDEVILDPLANIEEAQIEAAKTLEETKQQKPDLSDI